MRTRIAALALVATLAACKRDETPKPPEVRAAAAPAGPRVLALEVTGEGFVPSTATVKAGEAVKLLVTRKTDETCATEILIEGTDIKRPLPLNQPVEIAWTPTRAGKVKFGCAMDMMIGGVLVVE